MRSAHFREKQKEKNAAYRSTEKKREEKIDIWRAEEYNKRIEKKNDGRKRTKHG